MALTIELTPEEEARLRALASEKGTDEQTALRGLLVDPTQPPLQEHGTGKRSLVGFGILAGVGGSVKDFLREKHAELAREEQDW